MDLRENNRKFMNYSSAHPWETARLAFVRRLIRIHHPDCRHILDFGCGNGFVVDNLERDSGVAVTGIDNALDRELLGWLREKAGERRIAFYASLEDVPPEPAQYDTLLLLDVLEHVEDDRQLLCSLLADARVAPGALCIITVPAFKQLFGSHDRRLGHWRRYTPKHLQEIAVAAGAEVIEYGCFFATLLLPRTIQLFLEKRGKRHQANSIACSPGEWRHGAVLTRLLVFLLEMDSAFCRFMRQLKIGVPGLSCYLICRKPR